MDVAFIGRTAYVLVTLVSPDVGGSSIDGIYRVDGPHSFTVVADIGTFSLNNPPEPDFFIPTGLQYALQSYRGGFLVTDGHHNRVLRVARDGEVTERIAFGNVVPTGLDVSGNTVYVAQAGPVPHEPANGKVVSFQSKSSTAREVASGAPLLVDVEFGRGRDLFALSQGVFWRRRSRLSGEAEHRQPREGEWERRLHGRHEWLGPADFARAHPEHRVRRHPRWRDLGDRRSFGSAPRAALSG